MKITTTATIAKKTAAATLAQITVTVCNFALASSTIDSSGTSGLLLLVVVSTERRRSVVVVVVARAVLDILCAVT